VRKRRGEDKETNNIKKKHLWCVMWFDYRCGCMCVCVCVCMCVLEREKEKERNERKRMERE
jgi:hypothetical protein